MRERRFHKRVDGKRRGVNLPWRLPISAHRGVTLVELMISMLILAIVCISWLQIIGIQSARKEARRREAVERLAGMMDVFLYKSRDTSLVVGYYTVKTNANHGVDVKTADDKIQAMFEAYISPIGYQLQVVAKTGLDNHVEFDANWGNCKWLVGRLYDRSDCSTSDAGKPFFTLPVCLGF